MRDGSWKCCPLMGWTAKDVWAYIVSRRLPYNRRIYDAETHDQTRETIRNTGWLSTDGAAQGRIAWLRAHFPTEYRLLADEFPQVETLT
jgi:phosphoadenosine phosphosulfate reductase